MFLPGIRIGERVVGFLGTPGLRAVCSWIRAETREGLWRFGIEARLSDAAGRLNARDLIARRVRNWDMKERWSHCGASANVDL